MLSDYFKTDGNKSTIRLIFFIDIIACIIIAILALLLDKDLSATALLIGALLLPVAGGKAVQSFSEKE